MIVTILAGGRGSRMGDDTIARPKAMVDVGGKPIVWHVMQMYAAAGLREFVIALGYKGDVIREQLPEYCPPAWKVEFVDTGEATASGGRLLRLRPRLGDAPFVLSWCDGVADIDAPALLEFHRGHGKAASIVAVHPPSRFGRLELDGPRVTRFAEKEVDRRTWINAGIFVLEARALEAIPDETTPWEREPLQSLARSGELMAYRHEGFWQCMDVVTERDALAAMWASGEAPWKAEL